MQNLIKVINITNAHGIQPALLASLLGGRQRLLAKTILVHVLIIVAGAKILESEAQGQQFNYREHSGASSRRPTTHSR